MDNDYVPMIYCCEVIVGLTLMATLSGAFGFTSVWVGLCATVILIGGTAYVRAYLIAKERKKRVELRREQLAKLAEERVHNLQENARKLIILFSLAANVQLDDVKAVLGYDTRKEALDLLLDIKGQVPGLQLEGDKVLVPNPQDLASALSAHFNVPALKTILNPENHPDTRIASQWLCETCGRENFGCVQACAGCGNLKKTSC